MRISIGLVVGLVCGLIGSLVQAAEPGPRALNFEERVKAQEAIERFAYRHQIGATKPFDEAVPRAVVEAKVRLYLEESAALETFWKTPITDEALQREVERMSRGTRMPERLQEIYAALGNDPFMVKECVARATLADRLTHNFYAFDPRYHAASRAAINALREQIASGALSPKADHPNRTVSTLMVGTEDGDSTGASTDRRVSQAAFDLRRAQLAAAGQATPAVETRAGFAFDVVLSEGPTAVRVATYFIPKLTWSAWWSTARTALRAESVATVALDRTRVLPPATGTRFDPKAACTGDGWNNGTLDDLPLPRQQHSAVWTGSLMLVWGGVDNNSTKLDSGGRYDPVTDSWQPMTTTNAPRGRLGQTAVWTGSEMIVWGGYDYFSSTWYVSGKRYDPIADLWTSMSLGPSARSRHTAVWTGSRMIIWGGYFESNNYRNFLNSGALYDPSTDTWTPTAAEGAPDGRFGHTAIWTGNRMLVWGGYLRWNGGQPTSDGGLYDPFTNTWSAVHDYGGVTGGRAEHSAIWTGTSMVIWGGRQLVPCEECPGHYQLEQVNTGASYDVDRDQWVGMSNTGGPPPTESPLTTWTGQEMLLFPNDSYGIGGWRYDPSTDHWTGIAPDDSSYPLAFASLVWTGDQAILWGGRVFYSRRQSVVVNSGRRYDPSNGSWTPTSISGPPNYRSRLTTVWTGNEMIVWGEYADGDRYDPATDSWSTTATASASTPRYSHTAVWTGAEMIVWGGDSSSGGRYDPRTDVWTAMSETDAPTPRGFHAAAWTGRRMVVWGGNGDNFESLNSGGVYDPTTDHWTATSVTDAPPGRKGHTAVWTGAEIVIWGGYTAGPYDSSTNTGGRYDPETDTWAAVSVTGAPSARSYHSAVWAGGRMVVWGGGTSPGAGLNTGGRYDPASDTWSPTTLVGAPPRRTNHAAVAAGNLMLTWGGYTEFPYPNTGGTYDVVNDRWTRFAPPENSAREPVTAVWTGDAMIVWSGSRGGRYYLGDSLEADCDHDGVSAAAGDCDDHNPATYPGAPAACDGVGNDCTNLSWPLGESDHDGDGWLTCAGDCDDNNVYVHPGQAEVCDGWDTDCDGQDPLPTEADNDQDGYRLCQADCDDTARRTYPGAWEYCDGRDNNCDGAIDEGGDTLCTSSDVCLTATCEGLEGCRATPNAAPCDDANACTSDDVCADGYCLGTPLDGTACDDNNICTTNDVCGDYYCNGTPTVGNACNDYNICTTDDTCENGQCLGGAPLECDDGNPCNGIEYCYYWDGCIAGTPINCNDGNICTDDSCDAATGCVFTANTAACDDYNFCTLEDVCRGGQCQGTPRTGTACDDYNLCTTDDACNADGGCIGTLVNCDDGDACNGTEVCYQYNGCHPGSPLYCDDGNICTTDSCNPATGCVHVDSVGPCDDGNACTVDDTCGDGVCTGTPRLCDDHIACTTDSCTYYGCVFVGNPSECDDNNACTDDFCDSAAGGCVNVNNDDNACTDGNACTRIDECHSGACTSSNPIQCGGDCPEGSTAVGGLCQKTYDIDASLLDNQDFLCDGTGANRYNNCNGLNYGFHWTDLAGSLTEVTHVDVQFASGVTCGGGTRSVTLNGALVGHFELVGSCACASLHGSISMTNIPAGAYAPAEINRISIGPSASCEGLSPDETLDYHFARVTVTYRPVTFTCRVGMCDPGTGACVVSDLPDGTECTDENVCTTGDTCSAGNCDGTSVSCDDNNPCTDDSCDPTTGCAHIDNTAACDDGNACTTGDTCDDGTCNGSGAVDCEDGNACNGVERCDPALGCVAGTGLVCNDGKPCTDDSCDPGTGCVFTNNTNPCDDGNACTRTDACSAGSCVGGNPVTCGGLDQCHDAGTCNTGTGACSNPTKPNGTICDDASLCTTGETCQSGTCTPALSGLNHPTPKSAGYYKKLCQQREHNPSHYQGDELTAGDAACVGQLTSTFAGMATIDELCEVINTDHRPPHGGRHHGGSGDGPNGKDCDKGENELIATALNICRARVCEEQNLDSRCHGNTHTTVSQSFADADASLDDAARNKDTCKSATCELREINNGHALEMNSLALARENGKVRLTWSSPVLDDGSGEPSSFELWRRPMGSNDSFVKIGTTSGLTFLDAAAGAGAWEYDITAVISGN